MVAVGQGHLEERNKVFTFLHDEVGRGVGMDRFQGRFVFNQSRLGTEELPDVRVPFISDGPMCLL